MQQDGPEKLHIVADFDKTLTKAYVNGVARASLVSILRDNNQLISPEYAKKAHELFNHYHPQEKDPKISTDQKKAIVRERYDEHLKLLIEVGLTRDIIHQAIDLGTIQLRDKVKELIEFVQQHKIPFVIISATGLGTDAITYYLEKQGISLDGITIISNQFIRDENGKATGRREPVIHSMNKDEHALLHMPNHADIIARTNVILLGDSPGDIEMSKGISDARVLKIGFRNEKNSESDWLYESLYDVLIYNDGTMEYVYDVVKKIVA